VGSAWSSEPVKKMCVNQGYSNAFFPSSDPSTPNQLRNSGFRKLPRNDLSSRAVDSVSLSEGETILPSSLGVPPLKMFSFTPAVSGLVSCEVKIQLQNYSVSLLLYTLLREPQREKGHCGLFPVSLHSSPVRRLKTLVIEAFLQEHLNHCAFSLLLVSNFLHLLASRRARFGVLMVPDGS